MNLEPSRDQAIYVPSVIPSYAMAVHAQNYGRDMPAGLSFDDLNFLNADSRLLHVGHVMSSAGHAANQSNECIITTRDRRRTVVIGDSGGFQIIGGVLKWHGDVTRKHLLKWLGRQADWAMTLDVPTRAVENPKKSGYGTFKACLTATLKNLNYCRDHREELAPDTKFLNVLQGENQKHADQWYQAVKHYDFEGWAFAGRHRLNFYHLCRRIIEMAEENLLQERDWIHVLGTNRISVALGLTALQRAINKHINPCLRISYDTSSPFRMVPRWRQAYSLQAFDQNRAVLQSAPIPDGRGYVGNDSRFPWSSPLGDQLTMGDICVKGGNFEDTYWDGLSLQLLQHHNYASLLLALRQAHRIYDMDADFAMRYLPPMVAKQRDVIDLVIKSGEEAVLKRNRSTLQAFAMKEKYDMAWDDDEDYQGEAVY